MPCAGLKMTLFSLQDSSCGCCSSRSHKQQEQPMFSSLSSLPQSGCTNLALLCKQALGCRRNGFLKNKMLQNDYFLCHYIHTHVVQYQSWKLHRTAKQAGCPIKLQWHCSQPQSSLTQAMSQLQYPFPTGLGSSSSTPSQALLPAAAQFSCSSPGKGQKHPGETISHCCPV